MIRSHDLERWLAPRERDYLRDLTGDETLDAVAKKQAEIDIGWRQEALEALLWSLGFVDVLPPDELCGDEQAYEALAPEMDPARTKTGLEYRPLVEIASTLDLYYCLHWHLREAELSGQGWPDQIEPGVVLERRTAMEWLFEDVDWDETDTST